MSDLISRRNLIKETDNFSQGNDDSSQGLVKEDSQFMADIISEICDHAAKKGYDPDETLSTVAKNILNILKISTFRNWREHEG